MSPNLPNEDVTETPAAAEVVTPKSKKINLSRPGVLDGDLPPAIKDKQPTDERIRRREVLEDGTIIETY
jgi:hypothetical protein